MRLPLRARLTALYAVVFLAASGALLTLSVLLVNRSLDQASAVTSPAQQAYRAQLEAALAKTQQDSANSKPSVAEQKKQADLKEQLIQANETANGTMQTGSVNTLIGTSLLVLLVLVPAAAFGSWMLAGRALRPVGAITEAAQRASGTRLHERLALTGPRDEITKLADTFDDMLDRLEHAFDAQRRFVANASHELRTPLTVARTAVEVTLAKPDRTPQQLETMASDVHGALAQAEHLVDSLLTLTRSEFLARASEPVDLATAAQDALDALAGEIAAHGVVVHTELNPAPSTGDRPLLDRLVSNLIDNAVRHNRDNGRLSVHTGHDGRYAMITVANSGTLLDPAELPRLFEPFQRANGRARSDGHGLGLGLSIVRAVAGAHHAEVAFTARPTGGIVAAVRLPCYETRG
jgi:signal transduction histidine kinase